MTLSQKYISVFLPCSLYGVFTTPKWSHPAAQVLTQLFRAKACPADFSDVIQMSNIKSQHQESKLDFPLTSSKQLQNVTLQIARPFLEKEGLPISSGTPLILS